MQRLISRRASHRKLGLFTIPRLPTSCYFILFTVFSSACRCPVRLRLLLSVWRMTSTATHYESPFNDFTWETQISSNYVSSNSESRGKNREASSTPLYSCHGSEFDETSLVVFSFADNSLTSSTTWQKLTHIAQ